MKINQLNLSQQNPIIQKQQVVPYRHYASGYDSFTKQTPNTVSFKGGENIYAQILKSPKKTEQFMGLLAAGAAALLAAAGADNPINSDENTKSSGNILGNIFSMFGQNNTNNTELDKYIEENEKLKQENEALKTKLEKLGSETKPAKEIIEQNENLTAFPKKRGRLSANQQELKNIVASLNLPDSMTEKLFLICEELLTKNSHTIEGEQKDNDEITKNLSDELKLSKDDSLKTKYIINKYFTICELKQKKSDTNDLPQDDTNFISLPKLEGTKVIGKIELPETTKAEKAPEIIIRDKDGNIESIFFKKAGTQSKYSAEQIDDVLKYFVKTIYNDYKEKEKDNPKLEKPKWLYNTPIRERIRKSDVAKEVAKQNNPKEQYKHITKEYYQEIVDAINEDPRYNDLFDIHSALRLFDRYIDFQSVDGIDVQSKRILDKLFELIEQAYKDGIQVDVYKDKKSGYIGPTITLNSKNFDAEAIKIFGSTDIVIGISERQNGKVYKGVNNDQKEAIISTIYPKDI